MKSNHKGDNGNDYDQAIEELKLINGKLFYNDLKKEMKDHNQKMEEKYSSSMDKLEDMAGKIGQAWNNIDDRMERWKDTLNYEFEDMTNEFQLKHEDYSKELNERDTRQRELLQKRLEEYYNLIENKWTLVSDHMDKLEGQSSLIQKTADGFIVQNVDYHNFIKSKLAVIGDDIVKIEEKNFLIQQTADRLVNKLDIFIAESEKEAAVRHQHFVWLLMGIAIGLIMIIFKCYNISF